MAFAETTKEFAFSDGWFGFVWRGKVGISLDCFGSRQIGGKIGGSRLVSSGCLSLVIWASIFYCLAIFLSKF